MLLAMCCESSLNLQVVVCADMDLSTQLHPNGVVPCAVLLKAWQIMAMGYSMAFCGLYNNPSMVTLPPTNM
jgi:hypothetical protein